MPARPVPRQERTRNVTGRLTSTARHGTFFMRSGSWDQRSARGQGCGSAGASPSRHDTFPESQLNSKNVVTTQSWLRNNTVFEIVNSKGFYICAGVGGPITGKGGDFAIIDDPVKNAEEAASPTIRNKHWEWFTSTFYTRLEKDGAILLTMTRWNEDDLDLVHLRILPPGADSRVGGRARLRRGRRGERRSTRSSPGRVRRGRLRP